MRGPTPQPDRPPACHFRAGCPPRIRAWPTILSVPSALASNPSTTTVRATRPRCTSPRLPGRSGRPRSRGPLRVHQQRISGSYVSPAAGAAASLRHRQVGCDGADQLALDGDRDEDCDRPAGCDSKRARLSPPRWPCRPALLAVAEGAIAAYADITGETWKPFEASTAPRCWRDPTPPSRRWPRSSGVTHHGGRCRSRFRFRSGAHVRPAQASADRVRQQPSARCAEGKAFGCRSGGDQQCHQPFELADFLAETAHARAVCRLQPHGCGKVAAPCRPVPALACSEVALVPGRAPMAAASHAAIISASSAASARRRRLQANLPERAKPTCPAEPASMAAVTWLRHPERDGS